MKVGVRAFALALLMLISTWGLSGCLKPEPAAATKAEARNLEAEKGDHHAQHAEAKPGGHRNDGHNHGGHHGGGHQAHGAHAHEDRGPAPQGSIKIGDKAPDFSVRTLDGKSVKLSELRKDQARTKTGVVVLSFWCTTCHSCRDVEGHLAQLQRNYEGQAAVFAVAVNANETAETVAAFFKKKGWDMPTLLDPKATTADLFGTTRTTTTVVIDGEGTLRYCGQFRQKGGGSAEEALKAVLAGKEVAIKTTPHNG